MDAEKTLKEPAEWVRASVLSCVHLTGEMFLDLLLYTKCLI